MTEETGWKPEGDPRQERYDLYYSCFVSPAGKLVLEDLKLAFYDRQSHTPGDPYETTFKEGQRSVVKRIMFFLEQSVKGRAGDG